jgi:hypothetical protein
MAIIAADFCEVFQRDMKPLYLLACLLTANHKKAKQCFASTVEEAFKEPAVFKEWARSWARHSPIENAIDIVSPASARTGEKRDSWSTGPHQSHGEGEIDAVTKLVPLERFVFVMSILDRHSNWDCAPLLGCNTNKIPKPGGKHCDDSAARSLRSARTGSRKSQPTSRSIVAHVQT